MKSRFCPARPAAPAGGLLLLRTAMQEHRSGQSHIWSFRIVITAPPLRPLFIEFLPAALSPVVTADLPGRAVSFGSHYTPWAGERGCVVPANYLQPLPWNKSRLGHSSLLPWLTAPSLRAPTPASHRSVSQSTLCHRRGSGQSVVRIFGLSLHENTIELLE